MCVRRLSFERDPRQVPSLLCVSVSLSLNGDESKRKQNRNR